METIVRIEHLRKSYAKKEVLKDISLELKKGKIIGLLGPNGSGKTTLIKLMCGLLKEYSGSIKIDGRAVGVYTKSIVSYLPDEPYFADWMKVKDMLKIFSDMYKDFDMTRCANMMERFSLHHDMRIKTMSKGMKEKLQLALVMSRRAPLILLDEPIGGVDPAARDAILDTIISNYDAQQTILIATHLIADMERIFDSVIFVKEGAVILHQDVDEIRKENEVSINDLFKQAFKC